MAEKIFVGMLVKVGVEYETFNKKPGLVILITTMNPEGREYNRKKMLFPGQFLFGTVVGIYEVQKEELKPAVDQDGETVVDDDGKVIMRVVQPAKQVALTRWAGPKYRTSMLPLEMLIPAVKVKTAEILKPE